MGVLLLVLIASSPWGPGRAAGHAARASTPHGPFQTLLARSRDLGPLPAGQRVSFLAVLRDPSPARQAGALAAMYDPHTRAFGRYLTDHAWVSRFGPSPRGVRAVQARVRRAGIATSWRPGSSWLLVSGPARAIERVFRVAIHAYVSPSSRRFYAAAADPTVPRDLAAMLADTGHILSYLDRRASIIPVQGLRPSDLLTAYGMKPLRARGFDGSGQTIAFIEIDGFIQGDLDAFTQHFGLPAMHPTIATGSTLNSVKGEAELDLEITHEIAPGARQVVYNCTSPCSDSQLIQLENQAVQDNPRGIINISLGGCESVEGSGTVQSENNVFDQADALGESVLAASGDSGAYGCLDQNWGSAPSPQYIAVSAPASVPGVTAVGGTSLDLHANSTWYREEVWGNPPATTGSGGGMSAYFARPPWQRGPGVVNSYNTSNHREVPDVAADADPLTAAQVVIGGQLVQAGGTSQAAPIWAGMMAVIDQYLRHNRRPVAGFLNPALYRLAGGKPAYPPLHDVTVGDNLVYPATPGYDLASGLGTPDAWNLARDLVAYEGGAK